MISFPPASGFDSQCNFPQPLWRPSTDSAIKTLILSQLSEKKEEEKEEEEEEEEAVLQPHDQCLANRSLD